MKSKDILNVLGDVGLDLIDDAADPAAPAKGGKRLRVAAILAAAALLTAGLITTAVLIVNHAGGGTPEDTTGTSVNTTGTFSPGDLTLWVDTREKKGTSSTEFALEIPWEYLPITNRYREFEYKGILYNLGMCYEGDPEAQGLLTDKIDTVDVCGYDDHGVRQSVKADLYGIKGVDPARRLMIGYPGENVWVVVRPQDVTYSFDAHAPATLGSLIDTMSLTKNVPLTSPCLYDPDTPLGGETPYSLPSADSDALWAMFGAWADVPCEENVFGKNYGREVVSFSISSDLLSIRKLAWILYDSGYLYTNIDLYGYYFFIGTEAVEQVRAYVDAHKIDPIPLSADQQTICGTVTEIGDGWFKLDDSVSLKNPDEGIEFTVIADKDKMRFYAEKALRVGMTVIVTHSGIAADDPTTVRTATDVQFGVVITDGGDIVVQE